MSTTTKTRLFRVSLVADEQWLETLTNVSAEVWPGEVCSWGAVVELDDDEAAQYWVPEEADDE